MAFYSVLLIDLPSLISLLCNFNFSSYIIYFNIITPSIFTTITTYFFLYINDRLILYVTIISLRYQIKLY